MPDVRNQNGLLTRQRGFDFRIFIELYLEILELRVLVRGRDSSHRIAALRKNYRRMAEIESARETTRQHVKKLSHGERAHDVVQNVHQRPARSSFIE